MDTNKMREQFETSPKFRGMDFTRSSTHPEFYESPYANGAWDGWQASRAAVVVELPMFDGYPASMERDMRESLRSAIEAQGLKVTP
ncbi:hypothetical protein FH041_07155 [Pseudomonas sp. SWI7]|jgi:hypothetical protein|uniref:hypothetical protein n=1 Tax=Pseudomonas sp. SWI7 TaxID=2587597 RepID=UPI00111F121C|nr:hypothetical protein [Pseudomonas sp. SWI7]QDC04716.1 hypothetical protein FH041_07155 [Pseudomonas sp. SWI7]